MPGKLNSSDKWKGLAVQYLSHNQSPWAVLSFTRSVQCVSGVVSNPEAICLWEGSSTLSQATCSNPFPCPYAGDSLSLG